MGLPYFFSMEGKYDAGPLGGVVVVFVVLLGDRISSGEIGLPAQSSAKEPAVGAAATR